MNYSERIKELRTKQRLTQKQLGENSGLSESTIKSYEIKKRTPNLDALIKLSRYFGTSIDYIVGETENPERK